MVAVEIAEQTTIKQVFNEKGFAVLKQFWHENEVAALQEECSTVYEHALGQAASRPEEAAAFSERGCIFETLPEHHDTSKHSYCKKRSRWPLQKAVYDLLFSAKLRQLVLELLGSPGYLLNDQYIIKPPRSASSAFQWHHDSAWCDAKDTTYHKYLSVWCPLQDVNAGNGTLKIQPVNGKACEEIELEAGSVCVLSDKVLHCSHPNLSKFCRQVWMPQFSAGPLLSRATKYPVALAIPLDP